MSLTSLIRSDAAVSMKFTGNCFVALAVSILIQSRTPPRSFDGQSLTSVALLRKVTESTTIAFLAKKKMCSPGNKNEVSCFSKTALINIIKSWNKYYKNNKIKYNKNKSAKYLWKELNNKLKSKCNNDFCWTTQDFYKKSKKLSKYTKDFKPKMPKEWEKNINEWLSTIDIENVLNQYEKKYPEFLFIGAVPIDFDHKLSPGTCVINELCNINITELLKKKKTKIGIIFNLDKHDQDGSHWVSFFADLKSDISP